MAMAAGRTGGRILVDALVGQGAEIAFCVAGESYLEVLDAALDRPELRLITCRQEGGAAFMAEAYGKLTGRPAVCMVTRGPGACNASIGIHTAFQDSTPLVLLVGQVARDQRDREAFQEVDFRQMFGPLAKWVAQIDSAARIPEYVARAFRTAITGRPGPVVLALPEDMLRERADVPDLPRAAPVQATPPTATWGDSPRCCAGRSGPLPSSAAHPGPIRPAPGSSPSRRRGTCRSRVPSAART
ncbi:thiamine pyrophosphate-binding protein [Aerophototrophica crusticola]|uniref:thiamine pyrophosphate-binding protein n=1 Tax=Aerophototrophica crusticola TaxID=1709002 RepID=UPI00384FFD35